MASQWSVPTHLEISLVNLQGCLSANLLCPGKVESPYPDMLCDRKSSQGFVKSSPCLCDPGCRHEMLEVVDPDPGHLMRERVKTNDIRVRNEWPFKLLTLMANSNNSFA